jgi:6-phosphogluconolactonase/glucosamine-6-phosphate isomerase/deaminase
MEIIATKNPAQVAGESLARLLQQYHDMPILLLLSGGSALAMLSHVPYEVLSSNITLTVLDERFSTNPSINNFAQLETTDFFKKAMGRKVSVISTKIKQNESLLQAGERFAAALHVWRAQHENGVVLATMGIGADGHTAGIFPNTEAVDFSAASWVVSYVVPPEVNQFQERITVTYTFLKDEVTAVVGYVVGIEKQAVIAKLQQTMCPLSEMPACILRELKAVQLVTDQVD